MPMLQQALMKANQNWPIPSPSGVSSLGTSLPKERDSRRCPFAGCADFILLETSRDEAIIQRTGPQPDLAAH